MTATALSGLPDVQRSLSKPAFAPMSSREALSQKSASLLDMGAKAGFDSDRWTSGKPLSAVAVISLLAWGLGYFGQPHILVRFMSIRSTRDIPLARRIGVSW